MYPNNIYVQNHEKLKSYGGDLGENFIRFDKEFGLEHNDLLQAQYRHWRAIEENAPELLPSSMRSLLGLPVDWYKK